MNKIISLAIIILVTLTATSCKKLVGPEETTQPFFIVDVSQESDWDYWVIDDKGNYMLIESNYSIPSKIVVKSGENPEYPIYLDANGLPSKAVVDDYIFAFDNFNGYYMDIAIIYPNGAVEVLREIETNTNWDHFTKKSISNVEAWSDVVRIASHVASGVGCGLSVAGTIASGGVAAPLAVMSCTGFALGVATEFLPEEFELLGLGAAELGAVSTYLGCASAVNLGCYVGIAATGLTVASWGLEYIEERNEDVQVGEAVLIGGYGDIQITLTWFNTCDLDLHVIEPNGEEIYWDNKLSSTGGYLDIDDTDGEGPENIFWEESTAPQGTYSVYVHNFDWNTRYDEPTAAEYVVIISAFGFTERFTGTVKLDNTVHVTDFNQRGILKSLMNSREITIHAHK